MAKTREEMLAAIDEAVGAADAQWTAARAASPDNPYGTQESGAAYELSANAMWLAGEAAFNYAASQVGASGFQGSWAALQLYAKLMQIEGGFIVLKAEDMLYPQYNLVERLHDWTDSDDMTRWLGDEAEKRLALSENAAERVIEHWKTLVAARDQLPQIEENE